MRIFWNLALLLVMTPASVLGDEPSFNLKWGTQGTGAGQFFYPKGVAVGSSGVYVTDTTNNRIQRFALDGSYVGQWGASGSGVGQFAGPWGIDVASGPPDTIYVVDAYNHRIQKFVGSTFLLSWGASGLGPGQFVGAYRVAVGAHGYVYVTDIDYTRVQKFRPDGAFVTEWGEYGPGDGNFESAAGIDVGPNGHVYVSDWGRDQIQVFDEDGAFISKWGSTGTQLGQFQRPNSLAIDASSGYVYVTDQNNHRIQRFSLAGVPQCAWGTQGGGDGQFFFPSGLCATPQGSDVFVVDSSNHRVQKFSYVPTAVEPPSLAPYLRIHPNPSNGQVSLSYGHSTSRPRIAIYDVRGRLVKELLGTSKTEGVAVWDGSSGSGTMSASGIYFARLVANDVEVVRKIILVR